MGEGEGAAVGLLQDDGGLGVLLLRLLLLLCGRAVRGAEAHCQVRRCYILYIQGSPIVYDNQLICPDIYLRRLY